MNTSSATPMPPPRPARSELDSALESILLVAGGPVSLSALASATASSRRDVEEAFGRLAGHLRGGIRLQVHEGEAQLVTAPENVEAVHGFLGTARPPGLSRAALETLAIIAYRQPVTRPEIEATRGVNSDRSVQTLMARGLIEERGQRKVLGRPMEYGTSFGFLEYFGMASVEDLPALPESSTSELEAPAIGLRPSDRARPSNSGS